MSCPYWPEISFCLNAVNKEKSALAKKAISLDLLTTARENISHHIEELRVSLEQTLDKQFASLIMFAVVAYFDEEIQRFIFEKGQANWLPLQKDFFGAFNAGELYFETIDKIIADPQTPPIIFKVFYFFLKKGFLGKYRDSKVHIAKYMEFLREKIPVEAPLPPKDHSKLFSPQTLRHKLKKKHYYAAVCALSLLFLGVLYFTSSVG